MVCLEEPFPIHIKVHNHFCIKISCSFVAHFDFLLIFWLILGNFVKPAFLTDLWKHIDEIDMNSQWVGSQSGPQISATISYLTLLISFMFISMNIKKQCEKSIKVSFSTPLAGHQDVICNIHQGSPFWKKRLSIFLSFFSFWPKKNWPRTISRMAQKRVQHGRFQGWPCYQKTKLGFQFISMQVVKICLLYMYLSKQHYYIGKILLFYLDHTRTWHWLRRLPFIRKSLVKKVTHS